MLPAGSGMRPSFPQGSRAPKAAAPCPTAAAATPAHAPPPRRCGCENGAPAPHLATPPQKLKNDLRQEISTQARLAAVEHSKGSSSVVVQQTAAPAAGPSVVYAAVPQAVAHENYCGPISLIIGIFLFP